MVRCVFDLTITAIRWTRRAVGLYCLCIKTKNFRSAFKYSILEIITPQLSPRTSLLPCGSWPCPGAPLEFWWITEAFYAACCYYLGWTKADRTVGWGLRQTRQTFDHTNGLHRMDDILISYAVVTLRSYSGELIGCRHFKWGGSSHITFWLILF